MLETELLVAHVLPSQPKSEDAVLPGRAQSNEQPPPTRSHVWSTVARWSTLG
eukprot:c36587_g1_i1 orf=54-209(-)